MTRSRGRLDPLSVTLPFARVEPKRDDERNFLCRGQDLNLGTPARADLESAAFGHSATPAYVSEERGTFMLLPNPRRPRIPRSPPRRDPRTSGPPGAPRPEAHRGECRSGSELWSLSVARDRSEGRSARAAPRATGFGPCGLRPNRTSSHGRTPLGYSGRSRTLYRVPIFRASRTYRSASAPLPAVDSRSARANRLVIRSWATRTIVEVRRPRRPPRLRDPAVAGIRGNRRRPGR